MLPAALAPILLVALPFVVTIAAVVHAAQFKNKIPRHRLPGIYPKIYAAHPFHKGVIYIGSVFLFFMGTIGVLNAWAPFVVPPSLIDSTMYHDVGQMVMAIACFPLSIIPALWVRRLRVVLHKDFIEKIIWNRQRIEKADIVSRKLLPRGGCRLMTRQGAGMTIPNQIIRDSDFRDWLSGIPGPDGPH